MANNNQSFIERALSGKEREGGKRVALPEGRWNHAWEILKGRLGRLFLLNLIVLITFLPIIVIYFRRYIKLLSIAATAPNGSGLGVGYPVIPGTDIVGYVEWSIFQVDIVYFSLFIVAGIIAALGIAGAMYLVRNLLRTDGVFDFMDVLRGIRKSFLNVLEAVLIFTTVLFFVQTLANRADYYIAIGTGNIVWLTISKIIGYVFAAIFLMISMWMIALSANYKQGAWELFRNAVYCLVKMFIPSVFFAAFSLFPFLFIVTGIEFFVVIGVALLVAIAFSFAALTWMAFGQWSFDIFTTPVLDVEQKANAKTEVATTPVDEETKKRELQLLMLAYGKSALLGRPMQSLEQGTELVVLPSEFTREDLVSVAQNREKIKQEADDYENAHKNEARYADYNKQFEDRDKALKTDKKKRTKGAPKMLSER